MSRNDNIENFGTFINDRDNHLPKSRGRCFDIGTWGGCGVTCPAFLDGECEEPQEFDRQSVIDEHGEDAEVLNMYDCFKSNRRGSTDES